MNKFWVGVVVLFLLINSVALGLLWFHAFDRNGTAIKGPVNEFLAKELQLTPVQIKQFDVMRAQHHETTQKLTDENRLLRDTFFAQIKTTKIDTAKEYILAEKISANQQMIEKTTLYHFHQFRSILTPSQQTRFDEVIDDVLHQIANQGHRPPGPGGRPRPNEPGPGQGPPPPPPGAGEQGPPPGGGPPPPRP